MTTTRVGICLTEGKRRKLSLPGCVLELCRANNIEVKDINMESSLEEQGPFDIILHKILEWCNEDVKKGTEYFEKFKAYVESHENIKLLDPIPTGVKLANRLDMCQLAKNCEFDLHGKRVFVPNFVKIEHSSDTDGYLSILKDSDIKFPVIVKHEMSACYGKQVHDMRIIFCKEYLSDLQPPCVVQQFHCHDGVMLKIYTIGEKYHLVKRPSIKNLEPGFHETIFFNSCGISKRGIRSPLHDTNVVDLNLKLENSFGADLFEEGLLQELLTRLHLEFDFTLLGIDIIVDTSTGDYGIVDMNYFPGYDGVKQKLPQDLVNLFLKVS
eukprot:gene9186-10160_t